MAMEYPNLQIVGKYSYQRYYVTSRVSRPICSKYFQKTRLHHDIIHDTLHRKRNYDPILATSINQEALYCIVDCYWLSLASVLEDNDAKQFFFVFMWYEYEVLGRSKDIYSIQILFKDYFYPSSISSYDNIKETL